MFARNVPKYLWNEAVLTAAQVLNRVTTVRSGNSIPFGLWHKKRPDISNVHMFSSVCYSQMPKALRHKLDKKAVRRIFIEYQEESNNYELFDSETRKFTHGTNIKCDDEEVGNFEFATVTVGDNMNSGNENSMDQTNDKNDNEQVKDSSEKEGLEPKRRDIRTLRPCKTLKPRGSITRYWHLMSHKLMQKQYQV